jgi:hypothetical protein
MITQTPPKVRVEKSVRVKIVETDTSCISGIGIKIFFFLSRHIDFLLGTSLTCSFGRIGSVKRKV